MISAHIIGAGVAGLCVATEMLARGANVEIFDPDEQPGPNSCSWWAGGMLAPWCEGESTEEIVVRLGTEALTWWKDNGVEVFENGTIVIANKRDQAELNRFARRTSNYDEVQREEVSRLEPDLADQFSKALYFEEESHLVPRDALNRLRFNLRQKGACFSSKRVDCVQTFARENPDHIVLDCRGLAAKDTLGDLRGVKGEMLHINCPDISFSRPVRLLHPRMPFYIVPRKNNEFMLGATTIENGERNRISTRSMLELLSAAYAVNPAFGEAEIIEIGVDARPAFPDNLPKISRQQNLISVNGFYRHGFLLAPAASRMVAEWLFENKTPEILHENSN